MSLTNTQYDELMREYDRRQTLRHHTISRRQHEIYEKAPELADLQDKITHLNVQLATALLSKESGLASHLRDEIRTQKAKRDALFLSLHLPEDYLDPPFLCADCQDTGFIAGKPCHCFRQAAIDLMYRQSGLRDIIKEENFEHFSLDYYPADKTDPLTGLSARECAKSALAQCRAFAEGFGTHSGNLLLFGDTGLGKTFLSHCIAAELMENGFSVVYFSASRMFEILADHLFGRNEDSTRDTMDIRTCDLLIIDDLGTEHPNTLTVSLFFDCLNERLLAGKSTLISTNLSLSDIREIYSERISSRVFEHFRQVRLFGDDIRIQKRTN